MNLFILGVLAGVLLSTLGRMLLDDTAARAQEVYEKGIEAGLPKREAFAMATTWRALQQAKKAGLTMAEFKSTTMKMYEERADEEDER